MEGGVILRKAGENMRKTIKIPALTAGDGRARNFRGGQIGNDLWGGRNLLKFVV